MTTSLSNMTVLPRAPRLETKFNSPMNSSRRSQLNPDQFRNTPLPSPVRQARNK